MNDRNSEVTRSRPTIASLAASADAATYLSAGGFLFLLVALAALIAMVYFLATAQLTAFDFKSVASNEPQSRIYAQIVSSYLPAIVRPVLMFLVAILASIFGFWMMQVSGRATRRVINPEDRELVSNLLLNNNEAGMRWYIKLSALTGIIGAFTKLDLSGLPLATIALTIIFAIMALLTLASDKTSTALLDLAKLTLGAFIGSYVQRQQGATAPGESGPPPPLPAGKPAAPAETPEPRPGDLPGPPAPPPPPPAGEPAVPAETP